MYKPQPLENQELYCTDQAILVSCKSSWRVPILPTTSSGYGGGVYVVMIQKTHLHFLFRFNVLKLCFVIGNPSCKEEVDTLGENPGSA
jgi:hypothetical protein